MKNKFKLLCSAVVLVWAGQVSAATSWTLTTGSVAGVGDNSAVTATSAGWANTGAGSPVDVQVLQAQAAGSNFFLYSGGLGINNLDGCSTTGCDNNDFASTAPEHAIDNNQRYEMVLLSFGTSLVNLTNAKFGWTGTSDYAGWD